mgnify:CR=1 FL=1
MFTEGGKTLQKDCIQQTEHCILCGRDTGVPIQQPVDSRKHYIHGCGQLCEICSVELKQELTIKRKKGMIETH